MGWWVWPLVAVMMTGLVAPTVGAAHCETKIHVYGRPAPAPLSPPPYSSSTSGVCVRALQGVVDEHTLPPNTDQVMVRVQGDFGPSVPALDVELDGLGFVDMHYALVRTSNLAGGYTYNLADWVALPDGAQDGQLTVTITQPGGIKRSITYRTSMTVDAPVV